MDGSNRTFRVSFTASGVAKLRDRVNEKLKEFMGDYTDDTLVEYVIVLLRNGRQKEEARKELDVFLGDDSASFVSWLWDHLTLNLDLYVQHRESSAGDGIKDLGTHTSQAERTIVNTRDIDYEQDTSSISRTRHNREWKGLVRDEAKALLFRSVLVDNVNSTEMQSDQCNARARQLPSLKPQLPRKRSHHDEEPVKRRVASRSMLDAPRRLLQFAVRDAVRTSRNASSRPEPSLNRLRSVVSASRADSSIEDQSPRERSGTILPGGMAPAIKAAAEAAEDVVKVRCSGNVFDRLASGVGRTRISEQSFDFGDQMLEDGEFEDFGQDSKYMDYQHMNEQGGELERDFQVVGEDAAMVSDFESESDGLEDFGTSCSDMGASQVASSARKADDSLCFQYSVAKDVNEVVRTSKMKEKDPPIAATSNPSRKIVNISVNVNTWKPENYKEPREAVPEQPPVVPRSGDVAGNLLVQSNDTEAAASASKKDLFQQSNIPKDAQKPVPSLQGSYTSSQPSDDVDSRIIFVSNVHFAATKDTLSRHFNKFGEVLKVIIVTDATTGQPKGSAYVEFLRKESAELALSLNGTSFMSRLLKVVKINTTHHETPAIMSWPRIARAASFASRLGMMPYPRGLMGSPYRARTPLKAGARSLQWKRDATTASSNGNPVGAGNIISPTGRNLTYVRPESKSVGNPNNS